MLWLLVIVLEIFLVNSLLDLFNPRYPYIKKVKCPNCGKTGKVFLQKHFNNISVYSSINSEQRYKINYEISVWGKCNRCKKEISFKELDSQLRDTQIKVVSKARYSTSYYGFNMADEWDNLGENSHEVLLGEKVVRGLKAALEYKPTIKKYSPSPTQSYPHPWSLRGAYTTLLINNKTIFDYKR